MVVVSKLIKHNQQKKMSNVYVPQDEGQFPFYPPPFYGNWNSTIGMGKKLEKVKKKLWEKDCC